MSTHNIHFQYIKGNHPKLSQICSYGIFSQGLKHAFETPMVNEPSVFELLYILLYGVCIIIRPRARYGLPPPPRGSFVDHDFLKAYCLRSILQHVSPLAVGALGGNSLL